MSDQHPFSPDLVVVHAAVEINGRKYQSRTTANVRHWNRDTHYQEHVKDVVLRQLGEYIVKELAPEVIVEMPAPTVHEALTEALRSFDYPSEY